MKKYFILLAVAAATLFGVSASAQTPGDVFSPIAKYLEKGDVESLSAWFADNLEVSIFSRRNTELLFEGAVKGGIIGKADFFT